MTVPPRISLVTLACRDVERMTRFFRELGWPEAPSSDEEHRVFQLTNGVVLGLFGAEHYERQLGPRGDGFRGFTLAVNVASRDEVHAAHETLKSLDGVQELSEPRDSPHGFTGFSFRDPEGNIWDVVWAEGTTFDERGGMLWP